MFVGASRCNILISAFLFLGFPDEIISCSVEVSNTPPDEARLAIVIQLCQTKQYDQALEGLIFCSSGMETVEGFNASNDLFMEAMRGKRLEYAKLNRHAKNPLYGNLRAPAISRRDAFAKCFWDYGERWRLTLADRIRTTKDKGLLIKWHLALGDLYRFYLDLPFPEQPFNVGDLLQASQNQYEKALILVRTSPIPVGEDVDMFKVYSNYALLNHRYSPDSKAAVLILNNALGIIADAEARNESLEPEVAGLKDFMLRNRAEWLNVADAEWELVS